MSGWGSRRFQRRVWLVVLLGLASLGTACEDEEPPPAPSKPPAPFLTVTPAGPVTLQVGQTVQISTNAGFFIVEPFFDFVSSNPAIVRQEDPRNLFRCLAAGTATVTVTVRGNALDGQSATVTQTVQITCQAANLIQANPAALTFTHTVGQTGCPQRVGVIQLFNPSLTAPVTVTASSSNSALTLDAGSFTLAPNETRDVVVTFNCSTTASFVASVVFSATSGNATDGRAVTVTATINR